MLLQKEIKLSALHIIMEGANEINPNLTDDAKAQLKLKYPEVPEEEITDAFESAWEYWVEQHVPAF